MRKYSYNLNKTVMFHTEKIKNKKSISIYLTNSINSIVEMKNNFQMIKQILFKLPHFKRNYFIYSLFKICTK